MSPHPTAPCFNSVQLDSPTQPSASPELPSPATLSFEYPGDSVPTIVEEGQIEGSASAIADSDSQLYKQDQPQDELDKKINSTDLIPNSSPVPLPHSQVMSQGFRQSRANLEDLVRQRGALFKEIRTLMIHTDDKDYNIRGARVAYFRHSDFLNQFRHRLEQGAQGMPVEFDDDTRKAIEEAEKKRKDLSVLINAYRTDFTDLMQCIRIKNEELLALEEQIERQEVLKTWCVERLTSMDDGIVEENHSEGEEVLLHFSLSPISPSPASLTPAS